MCQAAIVPCNLLNKFQPLAITAKLIEKRAKSFISNKYNAWFSEHISQQLEKGIQPADVKESLEITELKTMHDKWIVDLYQYFFRQKEIVLNGFKAAGIREAVESANAVLLRIGNLFTGK